MTDYDGLVRRSYAGAAGARLRKRARKGLSGWEQHVARQLPERADLLCLGCGPGREVFGLAGLGHDVTGVDRHLPFVATAATNARDHGERARFVTADVRSLPFAGAAFAVVTLWSQLLANLPTPDERAVVLAEARRVLRDGGRLTLSVHDRARTEPRVDPDMVIAKCPEHGSWLLQDPDDGTSCFWHYFDRAEILALCADAGFRDIDVRDTGELGEGWDNVLVVVASR